MNLVVVANPDSQTRERSVWTRRGPAVKPPNTTRAEDKKHDDYDDCVI